ncbi:MAG: hypothetical protein IKM39_02235 [Clostridia bacterium]|nr:hypothetical protein [Clostridia bacterium]
MKYDKYGDPIIETLEQPSKKIKTAFLVMISLLFLLVILNLLILFIPFLNLYLCFVTAPIFMFIYITFLKAYSNQKDTVSLPGYCKAAKILCPVLYLFTTVLAVFSGM